MLTRFLCASLLCLAADTGGIDPFVIKPYVQLGNSPKLQAREELSILWHAADHDANWSADYLPAGKSNWSKAQMSMLRRVDAKGIPAHRVYAAGLRDLAPGKAVRYRVSLDGKVVFESAATARKAANQPYRFAVFGDCAQGTAEQKAIAYQTFQTKPDFVAIAGDIVYSKGLISEYRQKYFPIYNTDTAGAATGAPLIRSTLFMASPGNHDIGGGDLGLTPDGLAYFLYWMQPLNGPTSLASPGSVPATGVIENVEAFLKSAGTQFPRMANFSFDYGNSHWTVIDSNKQADWSNPALKDWLQKNLAAAQSATWRFVIYHHPGFNSSKAHFGDQWMRLLAPVFEQGKVDIVFGGHVHNYQRSHPIRFVPEPGKWRSVVPGMWTLDKKYDGVTNTKPDGVLYIVTGAGGARLYNPEQSGDPASWQEFTSKFVSNVNSLISRSASRSPDRLCLK
ncbi:MAG: metallophosphoesterase [Candidatus Solibacter usitatus]|nr:metallophosphoesterase [Candidatus Solibacter usitatus]